MQGRLPVVLMGAGMLQLRAQMARAKSCAERLFYLSEIGSLAVADHGRGCRVSV
jgi:hypothetical protein